MKHAVWPGYLIAAVCFVIALGTSIANITLVGQLRQAQTEAAARSDHAAALAVKLAQEREGLSDMLDSRSQHHPVTDGDVITRGSHIYLALHDLPEPPRGKIYEAWTMERVAQKLVPAESFIPNVNGVAFVVLSADARATTEVAVTLEPEGGSKDPTSKPIIDVALGSP